MMFERPKRIRIKNYWRYSEKFYYVLQTKEQYIAIELVSIHKNTLPKVEAFLQDLVERYEEEWGC